MAWPALVLLAVTPLGSAAARLAGLTMGMLLFVIVPGHRRLARGADCRAEALPPQRCGGSAPHSVPHSATWYVLGAYAAFVLLALRPFVVGPLLTRAVQIYRVDGVSMSLTLQNDDRVIATPLSGPVRRRMVVVWRTDGGAIVTHRVVGMPGDRLEMRNFMLLVNGLDVEGVGAYGRPAMSTARERGVRVAARVPDRRRVSGAVSPELRRLGTRFACRAIGTSFSATIATAASTAVSAASSAASRSSSRVRWVFAAFDPKTHGPRFDRMGHDVP